MSPHKLLVATRNKNKVREISDLLKALPFSVLSIHDFPDLPEVIEDQDSLQGNAVKKAVQLAELLQLPTLADDTGLEVDALNGAPGVYSARFAGEHASYDENVSKLLREMAHLPAEKRVAQFHTVVALAHQGNVQTVEGICRGIITNERRGDDGFGYDPVFYYPPLRKTFAELSLQEKNTISHRAIALQKMIFLLKELFGA
jgi:XTP/dITP diphosphohydrolase